MERSVRKTENQIRLLFIVLSILILVVSAFLAGNALKMHQQIERRTGDYLSDVSAQIVDKIDSRIDNSVQMLQTLRDSAVLFSSEQARAFLESKRQFSGYDGLWLFDDWSAVNTWLAEAYSGTALDEQSESGLQLLVVPGGDTLIYCVSDSEESRSPVIVGIKTSETLERLLNEDSFDGQGISFVITGDGTVISMPEERELARELDKAYHDGSEAEFTRMEADIQTGRSGIILFTDTNGEKVMVRYEPLRYTDWYVITMIPADIISGGISMLSVTQLIFTMATIFLLGISMAALTISYRSNRKKLEQLAFCDEVTGGMNYARFQILARDTLKEKERQYAMVSMDVQEFKLLNKVLGTEEGNRALKYLYHVLEQNLADDEPMARNVGDIFYFLLHNRNEDEICARLGRIYEQVKAYQKGRKDPYYIELRFGIYMPEGGGETLVDMQEKANIARKSQKDGRHQYHFYSEERSEQHLKEKELMASVEKSLQNGEFMIYLQPKVRLDDCRIAGAEALIRWRHPQKGLLSPDMFIPAAEQYRVVGQLDLFVFEQVCRVLSRWKQEGKELFPISVNLSRQNLETLDFLDDYSAICRQHEVSPSLIEFELTETIMFENPQGVKSVIDEIHKLGFQCSLDDFGTGFSSLGLLNDLYVDAIKLDRSFFYGKNNNRQGRYIVEAILKLAAQLHIRTVAEGIDSMRQVQYLRQTGCNMIQGFVFFKPMPVDVFEETVFEEGWPRYVRVGETVRDDPPVEVPGIPARQGQNESVMMFTYFPQEDEVVFSSPFSPALGKQYTFPNARALFRTSELIHENDREDFFRMLDRCQREDGWVDNVLRFYMAGNRYEWLELHLHRESRTAAGEGIITGILVNTASWKNELDHWKEKANRDALTGLYNRAFFELWTTAQLKSETLTSGSVIFLDIDDFKKANDTLGHAFGDDILCCIAKRILGVFRQTDVVARYGGDEFVIFVGSVTKGILLERLEQLCGVFRYPYRNGSLRYKISGSVGAAMYPEDGRDYERLMEHADAALYEAKRRGKDQFVLYEPYMSENLDKQEPPDRA